MDFIAAEELDRTRGFWWSPGVRRVLVEVVDETPVQEWWISDPAHPERRPVAQRYPAAGTANADVALRLLSLDGATGRGVGPRAVPLSRRRLVEPHGDPLLVVMTRDQKTQHVLAVDPATAATRTVAELHDHAWVDAAPGATAWSPDGRLLTLRADHDTDTYRLHLGDAWLTPAGLQVRGVSTCPTTACS